MKTIKLFVFAAAFMLAAGLSATAFAQRDMEGLAFRMPPEPDENVVKVIAIEVTHGTKGYDGQTKEETSFGYSFLGQTTGSFPGTFTLSMNCTLSSQLMDRSAVDGIEITPIRTGITGGSWTLPVYMNDFKSSGYVGSFYGTVSKGEMIWDESGANATVFIELSVEGGSETWDGTTGNATFTGSLTVDEKTQKTTLTGGLVFNFTPMN